VTPFGAFFEGVPATPPPATAADSAAVGACAAAGAAVGAAPCSMARRAAPFCSKDVSPPAAAAGDSSNSGFSSPACLCERGNGETQMPGREKGCGDVIMSVSGPNRTPEASTSADELCGRN